MTINESINVIVQKTDSAVKTRIVKAFYTVSKHRVRIFFHFPIYKIPIAEDPSFYILNLSREYCTAKGHPLHVFDRVIVFRGRGFCFMMCFVPVRECFMFSRVQQEM